MIFYMETNFKKEPSIGEIPTEWGIVKLGNSEVASLIKSGSTPAKNRDDYWNGSIPFVTIGDMTKTVKYLYDTENKITEFALKNSNTLLVPENSILLSMYGTVGKIVINKIATAISQNIAAIIPNRENVDAEFLHYVLMHYSFQFKGAKIITLKHLDIQMVKNAKIPLPPIEEQRAIAEVLSAVDSVIAKTDEVIAKTERLKKGLMQTLLTKGIGHKEFKETEIGKIPKTWQVVKLEEVVLEAKSGFASGKRDENGILQLRMDNIEADGWINPAAGVKVPIPPDVEEYLLKPGDILFNNTNSVDLIGKTAIFRGEIPKCVFSNHLTRIRANRERVIPEWILYVLVRKWQTGVFKAICHRYVHQAGINNNDLLNIKIPLPEISEQQKIVHILLTTDKKLKIEKQEKARLEKIKRGLMDLLLTGKIRVKVD